MNDKDKELARNIEIAELLGFQMSDTDLVFTCLETVNDIEYTIYLTFQQTQKGQFYAYSDWAPDTKLHHDQLKKKSNILQKYEMYRDSDTPIDRIRAELYDMDNEPVSREGLSDLLREEGLETGDASNAPILPHEDANLEKANNVPTSEAKVTTQKRKGKGIIAVGMEEKTLKEPSQSIMETTSPIDHTIIPTSHSGLPAERVPWRKLTKGIDYYDLRGQLRLTKEGTQKLLPMFGIRETHIEILQNEPENKLVRVTATSYDGRTSEAIVDWDQRTSMQRALIKAMGKTLRASDVSIMGGIVNITNPEKALYFANLLADEREFALRKIIGKAKRNAWGELIGITVVDKEDLIEEARNHEG